MAVTMIPAKVTGSVLIAVIGGVDGPAAILSTDRRHFFAHISNLFGLVMALFTFYTLKCSALSRA